MRTKYEIAHMILTQTIFKYKDCVTTGYLDAELFYDYITKLQLWLHCKPFSFQNLSNRCIYL